MKVNKLILSLFTTAAFSLGLNAQADECTRYKAIAGDAYQAKNYEKVTFAYNIAQKECGTLEMKFYNPYIYSVKMAMRNAPDAEAKAAYLDTLINVYEVAQKTHGMQAQWQSYLGYSYLTQGKPGFMKKADDSYKIGIHHDAEKANEGMMKQYYSNLYNLFVQTEDEEEKNAYRQRLISEYFQLSDYANKGGMSSETIDFFGQFLDRAVTDCESVLPSINEFMKDLPADVEAKKSVVNNFMSLLEKKSCTSSNEYAMLVDTIIAIDPSVGAVLAKAKLLVAQNKVSQAISTYNDALKLVGDDADQKSDIELAIAQAYFSARNYKSAHNAGINVTGKNSATGYGIAARSVNATINDCGASTFDRKANNYYAVELAQKAGDSNLVERFKRECPTSNDLFIESKEEGEEVRLDCWGKTYKIVLY